MGAASCFFDFMNAPVASNHESLPPALAELSRVRDRYGDAGDAGFQPLPDVLLFHQAELKIGSEDLNVLLNILVHWYVPGQMPFPRPTTIAKRMGVSQRSVQRSIARLRKSGLIKKCTNTDGRAAHDVTPLVARLQPFARKRLATREGLRGGNSA